MDADVPGREHWPGAVLRGLFVTATALAALLLPITPAWAHGEGETKVGYVLIQQALGHLAHDEGHVGMDQAMEKIDDALKTDEQTGVDIALVQQAKAALGAEDIAGARALLERSIASAVAALAPATGAQTGTRQVLLPLRGRGALSGLDFVFAAVSVLMLLIGLALAVMFRPHDSIRRLRASLSGGDLSAHRSGREVP